MQTVEGTAETIAADIQRLKLPPNSQVLAIITEDGDSPIDRIRREVRPLVEADGLTDDDIDDIINEAREYAGKPRQ